MNGDVMDPQCYCQIVIAMLLPAARVSTARSDSKPVAASNEDEENECPVCYVLLTSAGPRTAVTCKVCKYAVCGECDTMMTYVNHERCPMCRTPRPRRSRDTFHTFQCTAAACESPQCTDTKLVLLRIEVHAVHCTKLELSGPDECKVCKLWRMLHCSRPSGAPSAADGQMPQGTAGAAIVRPDPEAVKAWLRGLPPAQVKRMLLSHVRQCCNRWCEHCRELREVIHMRGAAS